MRAQVLGSFLQIMSNLFSGISMHLCLPWFYFTWNETEGERERERERERGGRGQEENDKEIQLRPLLNYVSITKITSLQNLCFHNISMELYTVVSK